MSYLLVCCAIAHRTGACFLQARESNCARGLLAALLAHALDSTSAQAAGDQFTSRRTTETFS
eukprot:514047-Alexandrium_andersonii.AAC.1